MFRWWRRRGVRCGSQTKHIDNHSAPKTPAQLNFGDNFASVQGLPLLYKGEDFVHTNIGSAL
jgi:uncharacterized protein with PIN domain